METSKDQIIRNPWEEIYELNKKICDSDKSNPNLQGFKSLLRPIDDLLMFNTIRFGFGRQNGKTEWIIQNKDDTTLCIVLGGKDSSEFVRRWAEHEKLQNRDNRKCFICTPTLYSVSGVVNNFNKVFTKIIVDDASFVNSKKLREILEFLFEQERIDPDNLPELILVG